ncbi:MAG: PAS domain-containing protein [Verrucomicrobiales bacterium]|nr:PAS domain-containing protein [Verrucomicrobiales bacterium]
MSIHEPTGEKPGSKGRDSLSRTPNVFGVPGGKGSSDQSAAHHEAPLETDNPSSVQEELDWTLIADQFPFGLIVLGPRQELRHENAVCKELLGTTIRERGSIEAWIGALCPDDEHRTRVLTSFRDHVWRNQLTRVFSLKNENGKLKEIEFRSSLHQDGGITIVLQDVTESLRAQETQRHGKLKFRALFAGTTQGAILVDRTGRIIDANPAFLSLTDLSLREIRRSAFLELLHPEDAAALEEAESAFATVADHASPPHLDVRIRGRAGDRRTPLTFHAIGEEAKNPLMSLYLTGSAPGGREAILTERLQLVARKAKSLLDAVPDLIFLIDEDLTVADFAPPPQPWKELEMMDSWHGQHVAAIWPSLGELLSGPRCDLIRSGKVVHADLQSQQEKLVEFGVTLSSAGDGQILAVVRNQSLLRQTQNDKEQLQRAFQKIGNSAVIVDGTGTILEANAAIRRLVNDTEDELVGAPLTALLDETSCMLVAQHLPTGSDEGEVAALEATVRRRRDTPLQTSLEICSLSRADEPVTFALFIREEGLPTPEILKMPAEKLQHQFRNQLQMVTSLFSVETKEAIEDDNFIKWQLRLRALATAIQSGSGISFSQLIHQVSNEAARLMLLGPLERLISLHGSRDIEVSTEKSTPMALLIGELIRESVSNRKPGRQPKLYFSFEPGKANGILLEFLAENTRPGSNRHKATESIQLLTSQLGGKVSPLVTESARGWIFDFPA